MNRVYKFLRFTVSDKQLSNIMYAILATNSRLTSSISDLGKYDRKQVRGFNVEIVILIEPEKVSQFEQITGIELKSSKEHQGEIHLN